MAFIPIETLFTILLCIVSSFVTTVLVVMYYNCQIILY